mmetsp:Transcript_28201/g.40393  ORF Transcript_28201/g.40393 Transcript_28201/m.40393 type:complete len:149 (-) Transcript_28201:73-519(-)
MILTPLRTIGAVGGIGEDFGFGTSTRITGFEIGPAGFLGPAGFGIGAIGLFAGRVGLIGLDTGLGWAVGNGFDGITSVEVGFDGITSVEVGFDGVTIVEVGFDGLTSVGEGLAKLEGLGLAAGIGLEATGVAGFKPAGRIGSRNKKRR